jgi:hypothetical protein
MSDRDLAAWRPSVVIGSTYVAQGLVYFVGAQMLAMLVQLGTPIEQQVGLLATGALPWVLKFVLGLLMDLGPSWPLRVRALVCATLLAGAALATAWLGQAWASGVPESLAAVAWGWLAINVALAVQDAIVDALALDLLADHRALAATGMGLGHAVGLGLIGPLWIYSAMVEGGLAAGFEITAVMVAVVAATPLLLWAPGTPTKASERATAKREQTLSDWLYLLAIPLIAFVAMLGINITAAVGTEFLIGHLAWDSTDYATRVVPIGAVAGLLGALAWGRLLGATNPARAGALASLLLGALWLVFASLSDHWTALWSIRMINFGEGFLQAAVMVGVFALALRAAARSPLPITSFVLVMAALNLPRVVGPLLAPGLVERGWVAMFAVCGAVQILAGIALALLARRVVH